MASSLVTDLISFITTFITTGDATIGPISTSETTQIGTEKIQITESITVEVKKL